MVFSAAEDLDVAISLWRLGILLMSGPIGWPKLTGPSPFDARILFGAFTPSPRRPLRSRLRHAAPEQHRTARGAILQPIVQDGEL